MPEIHAGRSVRRLVSFAVVGLLGLSAAAVSMADVVITEVDPTGSSKSDPNTGYQTDWFELTNTGSTAVNISGWSMEDSHASNGTTISIGNDTKDAPAQLTIGSGAAGTGSIAPGQSVIFLESSSSSVDPTAFEAAWYGKNVPTNLVFGTYNDTTKGNFGLSQSGDMVNIFNGSTASSALISSVTFGAVGSGSAVPTFEVTGGIATPSVAGVDGAFVSANGLEVGSPGVAPVPLPPAAWLLLSGAALFLVVGVRDRAQNAFN
jgi:Lamin Tail Domain